MQYQNKNCHGHAPWKVIGWGRNGFGPSCCSSLCGRGINTFQFQYLDNRCLYFVLFYFIYLFFASDPVLAIDQVSPTFVRGTYGSLIQIATCLGLMASLFIGIPVKEIPGW